MVPPPVLPFGMPVNGFHPQMGALSNPIGPHPPPPASSFRRRKAGSSSSSSESGGESSSSPAPGTAWPVSLSGLIDSRTSTLVSQLRDDVRSEERHRRRMLRKKRRLGGSSLSSSPPSSSSTSFSESDTSSRSTSSRRSVSSSSDGSFSAPVSRHLKRQRRSYYEEIPRDGSLVVAEKKTFEVAAAPATFTTLSAANPSIGNLKSCCSATPKTVEPCYDSTSPLSSSGSDTDHTSTKASSACGVYDMDAEGGGFSDLYSEVFLESERPQLIATLGGRIVAWNDELLSSTGLLVSQLRGCVTVHNLVEPLAQSRLNDLFELALRDGGKDSAAAVAKNGLVADPSRPPLMVITPAADGNGRGGLGGRRELRQVPASTPAGAGVPGMTPDDGGSSGLSREREGLAAASRPVDAVVPGLEPAAAAARGEGASDAAGSSEEEDEDGETHLSMTLPCRQFRFASGQLCITIILMNDIDPSKRCFYCILTPPPTPPPQTIAFPAPSLPPMPSGSHATNGDYKSIGNGWYSALHAAATDAGMPPVTNPLAMMPTQVPMASPVLGKIRHIGQKQLASLL